MARTFSCGFVLWGFFLRGRGMRFSFVSFCLSITGQIIWKWRCANRPTWCCHCSRVTNRLLDVVTAAEMKISPSIEIWSWTECESVGRLPLAMSQKHAISGLSSRAFVLLLWSLIAELIFKLHWITALGKNTLLAVTMICSFNDLQTTCVAAHCWL